MTGFELWAGRTLAAGGLVLLVGWLAVKLSRGAARRHAVGAWVVRGAVLAAGVAALPGWLRVELPAPVPVPVASVPEPEPSGYEVWSAAEVVGWPEEATAEPPRPAPPAKPVPQPWPPERWLALGYGLVAGGLVARLLVGHLALVRLTRRARSAPPRVTSRYGGRVLVADRLASPVCFGLWRATVLLPRGLAATASATELGWVLAHEADHAARGDHRTNWWAGLAGCLFFPLPWAWAVRRELRLAQEVLADAAAAGGRGADYAAFLVKLSDPPVRLPLLAAGVRAGKSDLYRRVTMLLSDRTEPRRASRRWRLLSAAGAVAGAVTLGGLTLGRAAADEPKRGEVEFEVIVRADDAPKADGEKKPADGDKPAAKKGMTAQHKQLAELKEKIKAAAKRGDADEAAKLVDELEKAARSLPRIITAGGEGGGPGALWFTPGGDGVTGRVIVQNYPGLDEAVQQLEAQLDALGKDGNPQAREAMTTALNALKGQAGRTWRTVPGAADPFAQKPRFGAGLDVVPEAVREQLDAGDAVGVLVASVVADSPAAKAGIKKGDVLVKFAGQDVGSDPAQFAGQVRQAKAGKVEVVVVRKGKPQTLTADLPEAAKPVGPSDDAKKRAGQAREMAEQFRQRAEVLRQYAESKRLDGGNPYDGGDFRTLSVSVVDGKFTAKATNAGIEYLITGKLADGKPVPAEIVVKEGSKTYTGKAVKDLPENCHNALERLLGKVTGK